MDEILLFDHPFELLTAGLETDLYFSENIIKMIRNSRNITAWISNCDIEDVGILNGYKKRKLEGSGSGLFKLFSVKC